MAAWVWPKAWAMPAVDVVWRRQILGSFFGSALMRAVSEAARLGWPDAEREALLSVVPAALLARECFHDRLTGLRADYPTSSERTRRRQHARAIPKATHRPCVQRVPFQDRLTLSARAQS
jgi:hypothetical protein